MKAQIVGGKLVVQRTADEKAPLIQRLARVEGQVRGLRQMVEDNRYCGDAIQQANAVIAAVREVALMLISQQLQKHVDEVSMPTTDPARNANDIGDFVEMLRATYRLQ